MGERAAKIDLNGMRTVLVAPKTKGRSQALDRKWAGFDTSKTFVGTPGPIEPQRSIIMLRVEAYKELVAKAEKYDRLIEVLKSE